MSYGLKASSYNPLTVENRPRLRSSSDTTKLLVPRSRKKELVIIPLLTLLRGSGMSCQFSWERRYLCLFKRLLKTHLLAVCFVLLHFCLLFCRGDLFFGERHKCWLLFFFLLLLYACIIGVFIREAHNIISRNRKQLYFPKPTLYTTNVSSKDRVIGPLLALVCRCFREMEKMAPFWSN